MLSIAKRTAAGAALLLIMPLAVWVSGWQWQPWTSGLVAKNAILDNGNRDQTLGRYHACDSLWMVLMVPAISPARRHYAVCDSRRGDYRRAGREVMGKGARTGAAAICGLA